MHCQMPEVLVCYVNKLSGEYCSHRFISDTLGIQKGGVISSRSPEVRQEFELSSFDFPGQCLHPADFLALMGERKDLSISG